MKSKSIQGFLQKLRGSRKNFKENGDSLIVTLLLFPVIFASFGVAVDYAIGTYTQATLQSALDTGAQSALSRAINPGEVGNQTLAPRLTTDAAKSYYRDFYDRNRSNVNDNSNPFLKCQNSPSFNGILIVGSSGCGYTELYFNFNITGDQLTLDAKVYEESNTVFINMLGIDVVKYTISTSTRTTFEIG